MEQGAQRALLLYSFGADGAQQNHGNPSSIHWAGRKAKTAVDEAIAEGVFGVPTFIVDGESIWGSDRLWMNSACDWGVSDPLAVPKTALEMRRRGHSDDFVDAVLYRNPVRFLSQCPRFRVPEAG